MGGTTSTPGAGANEWRAERPNGGYVEVARSRAVIRAYCERRADVRASVLRASPLRVAAAEGLVRPRRRSDASHAALIDGRVLYRFCDGPTGVASIAGFGPGGESAAPRCRSLADRSRERRRRRQRVCGRRPPRSC